MGWGWASYTRPFKAILTIGTLHTGAPLAEAVLGGALIDFGGWVSSRADIAFGHYDFPICCDNWSDDELEVAKAAALEEFAMGETITAASEYFGGTADVLHTMGTSSAFVQALNTSPRIDHDAQAVPFRIGIASRLNDWNYVIWDGIDPDHAGSLTETTDFIVFTELDAYDYYTDYYNPEDPNECWKRFYASDWVNAAAPVLGLDFTWCGLIGASNSDGTCAPSDGIVPVDRQRYPGGTMNRDIIGPAHQQEKNSSEFRSLAIDLLANTVHVPYAPSPPSVYISGPSPTGPGTYTFTATAGGGFGGYTYRWFTRGDGVSFTDTGVITSSYTAYFYGGTTWLRVIVTSAGMQASAERKVDVSCGTLQCPY